MTATVHSLWYTVTKQERYWQPFVWSYHLKTTSGVSSVDAQYSNNLLLKILTYNVIFRHYEPLAKVIKSGIF
jgi:hypothetical protein